MQEITNSPLGLCPQCGAHLAIGRLNDVELIVCRACSHVSVLQRSLASLLELTSARIARQVDPDATMSRLPNVEKEIKCPNCSKPMNIDDYCAAGVVEFARCEQCSLLWLSAAQLGVMSMLWVKMNKRIELTRALNEQRLRDADEFVDAVLVGRAVSDMLGSGLMLRW